MEFPRTVARQRERGIFVMCIDYTETPPPENNFLRCMYCGGDKPYVDGVLYELQKRHAGCVSGFNDCQAFMGRQWGGWSTQDILPESK